MLRSTLALAMLALAVPAAAEAQSLPSCPSDQPLLAVRTVDVAVLGKGMSVTVSRPEEYSSEYSPIANLVLTVAREAPVPLTLADDAGSVSAVVETPDAAWFNAAVEWDQNVGKPSACHGRAARRVWVAPSGKTFGNPRLPRFAGTYAVKYRPLNYKDTSGTDHARWRVKSRCDIFACDAALRSNAGLRSGRLRLRSNGTYRYRSRPGRAHGTCSLVRIRTNTFTGEVLSRTPFKVRRAFRAHDLITLKVLKQGEDGTALKLRGVRTYVVEPTSNAYDRGCTHTYRYKDRVTLTLR